MGVAAMSGESQPQYDDEDQYGRNSRVRQINTARKEAGDIIRLYSQIETEVGTTEALQELYTAVNRYVLELEPKLEEHHNRHLNDDGSFPEDITPYYRGIPLGEITIHPPEHLQHLLADDTTRVIGTQTLTPTTITLTGLRDFIDTDPPLADTWTLYVDRRHKSPTDIRGTNTTYMPKRISETAYRYANLFADDIGLDIEIPDKQDATKITDDLLQEVEAWRKQNIQ